MRLKRCGKKQQASYKIVIMTSTSKRDGKEIKYLGYYNPKTKQYKGISVGSNGYDKLMITGNNSMSLNYKIQLFKHDSNLKGINACQLSNNAFWMVGNKGQLIKVQKSSLFPVR